MAFFREDEIYSSELVAVHLAKISHGPDGSAAGHLAKISLALDKSIASHLVKTNIASNKLVASRLVKTRLVVAQNSCESLGDKEPSTGWIGVRLFCRIVGSF